MTPNGKHHTIARTPEVRQIRAAHYSYYSLLWGAVTWVGLALWLLMLLGAAYGLALRAWRAVRARVLPEWRYHK